MIIPSLSTAVISSSSGKFRDYCPAVVSSHFQSWMQIFEKLCIFFYQFSGSHSVEDFRQVDQASTKCFSDGLLSEDIPLKYFL
jgi:hypothetical protein